MKNGKIANKITKQMIKFSESISYRLSKPLKRLITEIIYGIQASKDIKLSNISRALKEDIPLIKTENRLSRNLSKFDLTKKISEGILALSKNKIKEDTILALDITDLRKEYGKEMENLAPVYNGSKKEIGMGWWLIDIIGADVKGEKIIPLYQKIYSQNEEGFISENEYIINAIKEVNSFHKGKGIWAIDRGGDRNVIFKTLIIDIKSEFVIRLTEKRNLIINDRQESISQIVSKCKYKEQISMKVNKEGVEKKFKLFCGSEIVRLPFYQYKDLKIVVIKGFGDEPIILLTSLLDKEPKEILEIYLTRWKCEESFRFIKQAYNLEDIRIRKWQGLKNLIGLILAVFYFVSVELAQKIKLNILLQKIYKKAKRFFEIPPFKHYAIVDGLYRILFSFKGIKEFIKKASQEGFIQRWFTLFIILK
jgi:hypothetical protein